MIKIALLGYGTVGKGAMEAAKRAGVEVKRVLARSVRAGLEGVMTTDFNDILSDPEVEAVMEAIGGLHPAFEYAMAAMNAKKHFVTANKALVCEYYNELAECAKLNGVEFRCTSSVGGGLQWLPNLARARRCDEILSLYGIINGTTNFILTGMRSGGSYSDMLKEAQRLGFAEADPSADVQGYDARRKCAISASVAFGARVPEDGIPCEGITALSPEFIDRLCGVLGAGEVKLVASASCNDGRVFAVVQPEFVMAGSQLSAVNDCYNFISYTGKNIGEQAYYGLGAGSGPTGTGLVQDIMDIIEGGGCRITPPQRGYAEDDSVMRRYYLEVDQKGKLIGPIPVKDMFKLVGSLRAEGNSAAFAALPEDA